MKKPINILTAIVLAGITTASANTNALRDTQADNKALSKALKCTRSFVQTDTPEGEHKGYVYLQKIRDAILNNQDLNAIATACKKEFKDFSTDNKTDQAKTDPLINAAYPKNFQEIIKKFKYADGNCKQVSAGVDAALLVSLGVGVSAGLCQTDDGRRWVDAGLYAEIGFGVGGFVDVIVNEVYVYRDPKKGRLVDHSKEMMFYFISPVGPVFDGDQIYGIGVGLGVVISLGREGIHSRIIPLKNDWSEIVRLLIGTDEDIQRISVQ